MDGGAQHSGLEDCAGGAAARIGGLMVTWLKKKNNRPLTVYQPSFLEFYVSDLI